MKEHFEKLIALIFTLCLFTAHVSAQSIVLDEGKSEPEPRKLILPYAFYTQELDLVVGVGAGASGTPQPQAKNFATTLVTTNDSEALFLALLDYQVPFAKRLFVDFMGSFARYTDQRAYTGFRPEYPGEHAGSNDSDADNYIRGSGNDHWYELEFQYLLPIGQGSNSVINTYVLKNGLLVDGQTGGDIWNPMLSGRTRFGLSLFDRHRTIVDQSGEAVGDSNGTIISLEYDNRDFSVNPTKGSLQKLTIKEDFGINSSGQWFVWQLDARKYFDLGSFGKFRQSILALQYWTSYTPSWNVQTDATGPYIDGRPPNQMGSSLGGFYRFRSYPVNRFSDKAAVYYSAEFRLIPRWNPLGSIKLLKPLDIDWLMFVPFVELGRVAPNWSLSGLHKDMRSALGIGLRCMAQNAVFRLDTAVSNDSWSMYAMVGHPF